MIKYLLTIFLASATWSYAQWQLPARQVSTPAGAFTNLKQSVNATAPTNTVLSIMHWIDQNWIQAAGFSTSNSYTYANGTTQNLFKLIVRDYLRVDDSATIATNLYVGNSLTVSNDAAILDDLVVGDDASIGGDLTAGSLMVSNNATVLGALTAGSLSTTGALSVGTLTAASMITTNNDMAVSFMGYPKVTLTTNMVTVYSSAGTPASIGSFTNVFDLSLSTASTTGTIDNAQTHKYEINLGDNYTGYVRYKVRGISPAGASVSIWSFNQYLSGGSAGTANSSYLFGGILVSGGTYTNVMNVVVPINGKFTGVGFSGSVGACTYAIYDFSFYGVTNEFRNMGGF